MADIVKTIGTNSRDYSTMVSWEADLDNAGIYSSSDHAIGECYADSNFSDILTIDGGGTIGLSEVTLKPALGEGHDGTAGTGVVIVSGVISIRRDTTNIEQIEIDGTHSSFAAHIRSQDNVATPFGSRVKRCLIHGSGASDTTAMIFWGSRTLEVFNTIIYGNTGANALHLSTSGFGRYSRATNVTIHGTLTGITSEDTAGPKVHNCLVMSEGADFNPASPTTADYSHNISSDGTASGTGSLTNKVDTNQFVSIVGGSEDLHLISGSDAIDIGLDMGTILEGINIDIDGTDKEIEDLWDIGAHEFTSVFNISIIFSLLRGECLKKSSTKLTKKAIL